MSESTVCLHLNQKDDQSRNNYFIDWNNQNNNWNTLRDYPRMRLGTILRLNEGRLGKAEALQKKKSGRDQPYHLKP